MATTQTSPRESAPQSCQPDREAPRPRRAATRANRPPTDDEILGLDSSVIPNPAATFADGGEGSAFARRDENEKQIPRTSSRAPENQGQSDGARDSARNDNDGELAGTAAEPENLRAAFDANPELRQAWRDAHSYRESFATPGEARAATALLADLDRLDALFFSRRPEDHAELARAVAALDPDAFSSLARAMSGLATEAQRHRDAKAGNSTTLSSRARADSWPDEGSAIASGDENQKQIPRTAPRAPETQGNIDTARASARNDTLPRFDSSVEGQGLSPAKEADAQRRTALPEAVAEPPAQRQQASPQKQSPSPAQIDFFHSANAAAVRNVLDAIESQVERLLPDGVSKSARNRVVGEIYRELDSTLQSNRQLAQQMRDAFRSGALDPNHQRAVVSLITGRARQALPGVAKRVLSEWTSTVVAANHDRRARQRAAESRVDIAGSGRAGNDGIRPMSPRDIDYARLSDSDILNL
ncbi:MAG TPA: hypothetical protein VEI08_01225 [Candidatus Bathyarchaeia archaeon]|nr:hypothetical protein [Candidatus Bathyarchaeia archaeon]